MSNIVTVRGRHIDHHVGGGFHRTVQGVDLDIRTGESYGLVGESGSGKSTIALALAGYLPPRARLEATRLEVAGRDLTQIDAAALRRFRRTEVGVVYQEPARALNPTATIGTQIAEAHRLRGVPRRDLRAAVIRSLTEVDLPRPATCHARYPHELSGGQQQRVMIAIALAARPRLLILDEPTTGLDSRVQASVLELVQRLRTELGFASVLISHDLPLVAAHTDRIGILEGGRLVETTASDRLLAAPAHAYTRSLVAAIPPVDGPARTPIIDGGRPLVAATGLHKRYGAHVALDHVDLHLGRGETLGIVGESGSGKTTLGRVIAGLTPAAGSVVVDAPPGPPPVQVVFQSPDASLNPRRSVRQTLARAIQLLDGDSTPAELVALTGLPQDSLDKLPHQLSGGQKQRVAIARAFAGRASVIVCDEPTSALDVSVQSTVLDLLIDLQERTGVAYLFISHDLAVVRRIAHRVAVMHNGTLVETAPSTRIFRDAEHPYTRSLVLAARHETEPIRVAPGAERVLVPA